MTRRTGLIVGINRDDLTEDQADMAARRIGARFPGVTIAVIPSAASIAFEYDDDDA